MIRRLGHLCFVTDDLERMVGFYRGMLGLRVKFPFVNADGETFGYYIECGDSTFIEIFDRVLRVKQWGGKVEASRGPADGASQFSHLCLEVTGLSDFRTGLVAKGLKVTEIKTGMDRSLQAWTNDPDGNAVELMEFTHQSWQLQPSGAAR
jgi:lactoylglutathione lyase